MFRRKNKVQTFISGSIGWVRKWKALLGTQFEGIIPWRSFPKSIRRLTHDWKFGDQRNNDPTCIFERLEWGKPPRIRGIEMIHFQFLDLLFWCFFPLCNSKSPFFTTIWENMFGVTFPSASNSRKSPGNWIRYKPPKFHLKITWKSRQLKEIPILESIIFRVHSSSFWEWYWKYVLQGGPKNEL